MNYRIVLVSLLSLVRLLLEILSFGLAEIKTILSQNIFRLLSGIGSQGL